jgi:hypothetical protein
MDSFLRQQNLARFRKQLAETVEDSTRRVLMKLLAEEEAKERASRMVDSARARREPVRELVDNEMG